MTPQREMLTAIRGELEEIDGMCGTLAELLATQWLTGSSRKHGIAELRRYGRDRHECRAFQRALIAEIQRPPEVTA